MVNPRAKPFKLPYSLLSLAMEQSILRDSLEAKIERATEIIRGFNGAVVALSAGVDSSLVASIAKRALGNRAVAATAISESLPPRELDVAKNVAKEIGIEHILVQTGEIHDPNYASNTPNRCYYCKNALYTELARVATDLGLEKIVDGTQVDDLSDFRPGLKAAREAGVRSPLLEAGFSKKDVRAAARSLGLSVWDKPAMPCLSSRIPHGEAVTLSKLSMIGNAEQFIKGLTGVRELRVRHENGRARIEVSPNERHLFFSAQIMDIIDENLRRIGFSSVTLDLAGYRRKNVDPAETASHVLPLIDSTRA
jgi:pyridinium-3,5-biscarboxylic acid mononucleotide sulfurtransferase